jgi:hypothetical protein
MNQQPRLDYYALAPESARTLAGSSFAAGRGLDQRLKELVDRRISQINSQHSGTKPPAGSWLTAPRRKQPPRERQEPHRSQIGR